MGGEAICQRSERHPAGPDSVRVHGGCADQIGSELGMSLDQIIPTIQSLPKAQEMDGLKVWIARLINKNDRLQTQVADRNRRVEEAEARAAATEARATAAEEG